MGKLFTLICLVIMSKYAMGYDYYYGYQPPTYTTGAPVYGSVPSPMVPVVPVYGLYNPSSGVAQYDVPTVSPSGYSIGSRSVVCVTTTNITVCN
jgi:hypothetical protein